MPTLLWALVKQLSPKMCWLSAKTNFFHQPVTPYGIAAISSHGLPAVHMDFNAPVSSDL